MSDDLKRPPVTVNPAGNPRVEEVTVPEPGYDHVPVVSAAIVSDICGEMIFERPDRTWYHG
jgi:hypothetical protein